jgi:NAD(P)-dependent dehydrogenase (short-subunit alcohol dehydrogenase family)
MAATTVAPFSRIGTVAPQALGTILITGGSSGLGAATAAAVQAAGGTPLVLDRVEPETSVAFEQVDLADSAAAAAAVDAVVKAAGGELDRIFTAAGIDSCGPLDQVPVEDWERVIRVNLLYRRSGPGGAALSATQPRTSCDVRVHTWHQGSRRRHRILRVEVRGSWFHSGPCRRDRRRGGCHAVDSWWHAYALL